MSMQLFKNSSVDSEFYGYNYQSPATNYRLVGSATLDLAAADTVHLEFVKTSALNYTIYSLQDESWMSITRIQ
jgi:hypothetical protein